ncbi:MAG: hypothetical protein WC523_05645 [Patescibacteria group bacterium]
MKNIESSTSKFREENGVIYFSVTSDGTTGEQWIKRLSKNGHRVNDRAKNILLSKDFKPTNGVTYQIAVVDGKLFTDENRTTANVRADANKRQLSTPHPEIAPLIREKFSDEDLGVMCLYWLAAMHEPINNSDGVPTLLGVSRDNDDNWLCAFSGEPGRRSNCMGGFAFVVSQKKNINNLKPISHEKH